MAERIKMSDSEWKKKLKDEQFRILRLGETEPPFSGDYVNQKRKGVYKCAGCGLKLFSSDVKYDSGSGWPSFFDILPEDGLEEKEDLSYFMRRTEIRCPRCGGHLGHVFDDGPEPTGLRYCVNSLSLDFDETE
ncbi:MAG: peptide-methionine (R)-S-oxide reductase MsrB [Thermoplasmatota archaeon]